MLVSMNIPSLQVVVMGKVFSSGNSTLTGTLDFDVTFLEILQYNFFCFQMAISFTLTSYQFTAISHAELTFYSSKYLDPTTCLNKDPKIS